MHHRFLLVAAIVLVALADLGPAQIAAQSATPNASSPLGTNTDFFRWFSGEWVFLDAFKQSRPWLTQCITGQQPDCTVGNAFDTGEEGLLDLDANGWVRSLPRPQDPPIYWIVTTMMFQNIAGHYPGGQYVVLYDGQGTLVYAGDATKNNALSAPHRDVLDVTPTATGIIMQLTATDPGHTGDYIRNIRVIMPGFEATYATQIFHPTFLARIAKYKTIRFKDWLETAASTQSSWSTRALTTAARWDTPGGAGIPIEILMTLANRNQSDVWVNMPHMADDDYITQFATLVKSTLAPKLKVYVEYSNEVWNGAPGLTQSRWVQEQAVAKWTGPQDPFTKQMNWHGMRTAQMCDIWNQVWGADRNRVVCVLGAQSGSPFTASQALDCPLWVEGKPCSAHGISAVGIAPYFGAYMGNATYQPQVQTWTSDADGGLGRVYQEITQGGALTNGPAGGALARARQEVADHVAIATQRGLYLAAYEGGTHIQDVTNPQSPAVVALFNAVNQDPRMGAVYDQYLADWRAASGPSNATRLFIHFKNVAVPNNIGSLGALTYVDQTTSPRYDALMRFIDNNLCTWPGCTTPALLAADLNGDGIVEVRDYGFWRQNFGASYCGNLADITADCSVDVRDYGIWRQTFGMTTNAAAPSAAPPARQAPSMATPTPGPSRASR